MDTSIRVVTPATSGLLMDPAVALSDLGLDSSLSARITRLVSRVSSLMVKELLFDPAYRVVEEGFQQVQGRDLLLSGRPLNADPGSAITRVIHPSAFGDPDPDAPLVYQQDYTVRYSGRPSGEGSVFCPAGWPAGGRWWGAEGGASGWWMGAETNDLDWLVTYPCGWWLPLMAGDAPEGVPLLPDDIGEACWISVMKLYYEEQVPANVQAIRLADREVQFRRQLPNRGQVQAPQKALAQETVDLLERYMPALG